MKKIILFLFVILIIVIPLSSCKDNYYNLNYNNSNYKVSETPHLYWKDIKVKVLDIDKRKWFAGTYHREVKITVYSEEYNLTKTLYEKSSGYKSLSAWDYKEGDIINAQLYSWVINSTGEIVKREINKIY